MRALQICWNCVGNLRIQDEWANSEIGALEGVCDICKCRFPTRGFEITGEKVWAEPKGTEE